MASKEDQLLVVLASLRAEGTPRLALDLCRHWKRDGVGVTVLSLYSQSAEMNEDFEDVDIEVRYARWKYRGYLRYLLLIIFVIRLCYEKKINAVLSMPLGWHLFVALGARIGGAARVVAHVGNYPEPVEMGGSWKFRMLVNAARPLTDKLACCSCYVQDGAIKAFSIPVNNTEVIYNGVEIARYSNGDTETTKFGLKKKFQIGMVGTLQRHKDQATLVRAVSGLISDGVDIDLLLAGEGSTREELTRLINDLGLSENVALLGTVSNIPAFLEDLDLFAFSTTKYEGQGIALVEAMAAGVPVIASDVGACREVLDGGKCGILVEAGNPKAMADGIRRLIAAPELMAEFAAAARLRVREKFDIQQTADAYGRLLGIGG